MNDLDAMLKELMTRADDDWVNACELEAAIKHVLPNIEDSAIKENALKLSEAAVLRGYLQIGDLVRESPHFIPWPEPPAKALLRLTAAWTELGRNPSLGELCWFQITDMGEEFVRALG